MRLAAIDPGPEKSTAVVVEHDPFSIEMVCRDVDNDCLASHLASLGLDGAIIEMVESYGMAVGREVFQTCFWIGRIYERLQVGGCRAALVYRRDVKLHLCGNMRAKDANIRQALLDRWGGRQATRKNGPLHGVAGHAWAALALAVAFAETMTGQFVGGKTHETENPGTTTGRTDRSSVGHPGRVD